MKILLISDIVVEYIYSNSIAKRFQDIDFVISCGDLPNYYLEFIVSVLNKPLFYVMGNHDGKRILTEQGLLSAHPGGCENLDGRIIEYHGLLIGGLEGSMCYNQGIFQYTEIQMCLKVLKLRCRLWFHRIFRKRYIDILVTHAPPLNVHDGKDLCHRGFRCFLDFIKKYHPRYFIHGHMHLYGSVRTQKTKIGSTIVINAYGHKVIELGRLEKKFAWSILQKERMH